MCQLSVSIYTDGPHIEKKNILKILGLDGNVPADAIC